MLERLIRANIKAVQDLVNTKLGSAVSSVLKLGGRAPTPPLCVELALTYRCNVSCDYCYQSFDNRAAYPDMSFDDVVLYEANIRGSFRIRPRLYLFGGEPSLNPDFGRIVRYLSDRGYKLLLTTNGMGLEAHLDDLFAATRLETIVLSLNPFNLEATERLLPLLFQEKRSLSATVSLNCPLDMLLGSGIDPVTLVRRFEAFNLCFVSFQHSQTAMWEGRGVDPDAYLKLIERVKSTTFRVPTRLYPSIRDDDVEAYLKDPGFPGAERKCVLPWLDIFVRPDGTVTPCDEVPVVVGNLREQSLRDIWDGERLRAFRRGIAKHGGQHRICERCCHRKYY